MTENNARTSTGRPLEPGTADETNYHVETKVVHGVTIEVKVYDGNTVTRKLTKDELRQLGEDM